MDLKIPNTTRYEKAGENFVSGSELLLYLFEKDSKLQSLEQIMRYILYKYTGKDYGVTDLNLSIFNAREFQTVGTGGIELLTEYIHYFENAGGAPTNADGTKYIIEDDGAGNPVVGYGVDINAHLTLFQDAGYPTNMGGEVDKKFVDDIEKNEIKDNIEKMKAVTSGLDLTEYQIHAMVSRAYNCGPGNPNSSDPSRIGAVGIRHGKNFVQAYQEYWNQETDDLYEEKVSDIPFTHELYTQYMSEPTTSDGQVLPGLITRRKSEWRLFRTGYYDVLGKWYTGIGTGGITNDEEAKQLQNYIETELIHTQVHKNGSYQQGPFEKWWATPINLLQPFQCTWWAYGRASMYLNEPYPSRNVGVGNGGQWYELNMKYGWFNYGSTPKPNSLVSWKQAGECGHVAYVEGVAEDGIYISEAGNGDSWMGIRKIPLDGNVGWGPSYVLEGYIYLDEPR